MGRDAPIPSLYIPSAWQFFGQQFPVVARRRDAYNHDFVAPRCRHAISSTIARTLYFICQPWEMRMNFLETGDIADVVSCTVLIDVGIIQVKTHFRQDIDGLEDRKTILAAATEIINFSTPRMLKELQKKRGHIVTMDLVPHLFSFISKHRISSALDSTSHDICQINRVVLQRHAEGP